MYRFRVRFLRNLESTNTKTFIQGLNYHKLFFPHYSRLFQNLDLDGSFAANPASKTLPDGSIKLEDGSEVAGSRPVVASESSRAALRKLLEHFLHCLQRKDAENFFAQPVNTATAPGNVQVFILTNRGLKIKIF